MILTVRHIFFPICQVRQKNNNKQTKKTKHSDGDQERGKDNKSDKKLVKKVEHGPVLKTYIKSGQAKPAPPLGLDLGQRNIQIGQFCKELNKRISDIKEGIPLPTLIVVNPDKSYTFTHNKLPCSWFLLQAAGIKKGAMKTGKEVKVASKVSHHVVHFAL